MALVNKVRPGFYLDSVALMRLSKTLSGMPGIEAAALMIGSASNRQILGDAGLLTDDGRNATANDLIIAIRASSIAEASAALATANTLLDQPGLSISVSAQYRSRSIESARSTLPSANLTLISVPGEFAAHEARKALAQGMNVMLFSDNVSYEDEFNLKLEATRRGLIVM